MCGTAEALVKLLELGIGLGKAATVGNIQPRQRADTVYAVRGSLGLEVWSFQIRFLQAGLANPARVIFGRNLVFDNLAASAPKAQIAVVQLQVALGIHQPGMHGGGRSRRTQSLPYSCPARP